AATFASIGILRTPARAAQFEYKYAHDLPEGYALHKRSTEMVEAIERETNGRLKITIYPNSILGGQTAMLSQLRSGAIQFLNTINVVYSTVVPSAAIEAVGFAFKDMQTAARTLEGPLGAMVRKDFQAAGMYAFEKRWSLGMRQVCSSTKPIKTVEDFAGFKMRTPPGKISVDLFTTLGASPTPITAAEMYTSLKTHLIDGLELPTEAVQLFKIYEAIKYISYTNHMWTGYFLAANNDAWNALPADVKAVVERNTAKYALLEQQDRIKLEDVYRKQLESEGIVFGEADVNAMRAKLAPYYGRWRDTFGAQMWALLENGAGTKLA
ncbi:MAG: TRAP transporter substrate-binding protein, partial [Candidatus Eremiobacteraeota bacterium]|nr:TRAP transporter substrate-binding protein [Candidatus Eremiobacteraeota bacterium]